MDCRAVDTTRKRTVLDALAALHGEHPLIAQLLEESHRDAAEAIVVPFGSGIELDTPGDRMEHDDAIATAAVGRRASVATTNGDGAHADHNSQDGALTVT